uniref:F5/8 type C domain-containing protein n=1 Tax=candidate division CPR3 bacterium TaxID=2268181 RepID=A0A7C4RAH9_UNCC3
MKLNKKIYFLILILFLFSSIFYGFSNFKSQASASFFNDSTTQSTGGGQLQGSDNTTDVFVYDTTKDTDNSWINAGTQSWSMQERDMNFTKNSGNPVIKFGNVGSAEANAIRNPSVLYKDGFYKMWYESWATTGLRTISYAISSDGITWNKKGIVLSPSSSGWDSQYVMHPSVIYDENDSKYKMWYTGTSAGVFKIGLATSDNGIIWTKSLSNPVVSLGTGFDSTSAYNPSVIYDSSDSLYKMWYAGNTLLGYRTSVDGENWPEATKQALSLTGNDPSVILKGGVYEMWFSVIGLNTRHATSSDGVTWSAETGLTFSSYTGASVIYDSSFDYKIWINNTDYTNIYISNSTTGLDSSWSTPSIVFSREGVVWSVNRVKAGSVIYDQTEGIYKMWYSALTTEWAVIYATSVDGKQWSNHYLGPVFKKNTLGGSWDVTGVMDPYVIYDETAPVGEKYKMWYSGISGSVFRIGYAVSPDGISWTRNPGNNCGLTGDGCVLNFGTGWESAYVYNPIVIYESGQYKMWYAGYHSGLNIYGLGYATSSDGYTWNKYANNPVFNNTGGYHSIVKTNNEYEFFYGAGTNIYYGYSLDGIKWNSDGLSKMTVGPSAWESNSVFPGPFIYDLWENKYKMWYTGRQLTPTVYDQIGLVEITKNTPIDPLGGDFPEKVNIVVSNDGGYGRYVNIINATVNPNKLWGVIDISKLDTNTETTQPPNGYNPVNTIFAKEGRIYVGTGKVHHSQLRQYGTLIEFDLKNDTAKKYGTTAIYPPVQSKESYYLLTPIFSPSPLWSSTPIVGGHAKVQNPNIQSIHGEMIGGEFYLAVASKDYTVSSTRGNATILKPNIETFNANISISAGDPEVNNVFIDSDGTVVLSNQSVTVNFSYGVQTLNDEDSKIADVSYGAGYLRIPGTITGEPYTVPNTNRISDCVSPGSDSVFIPSTGGLTLLENCKSDSTKSTMEYWTKDYMFPNFALAEFEAYEGGTNVALGTSKLKYFTSQLPYNPPFSSDNRAQTILDGNLSGTSYSGIWQSESGQTQPQEFIIDLGSPKDINSFKLYNYANFDSGFLPSGDFTIHFSSDPAAETDPNHSSWYEIFRGTLDVYKINKIEQPNPNPSNNFNITTTSTRYIKLTILNNQLNSPNLSIKRNILPENHVTSVYSDGAYVWAGMKENTPGIGGVAEISLSDKNTLNWNYKTQASSTYPAPYIAGNSVVSLSPGSLLVGTTTGSTLLFSENFPPVITNLGPSGLIDGSNTTDTMPNFEFTTSDANTGQTVFYEIEVYDNSDFSGSPVFEKTSTPYSGNSTDITIDDSDYGIFGLSSGDYYWRVRAQDNLGADSGWNYGCSFNGSICTVKSFTIVDPPSGGGGPGFGTNNPPEIDEIISIDYLNEKEIEIIYPKFEFKISDPDSPSTVGYRIQISEEPTFFDDSKILVDYKSQNGFSENQNIVFTVGQNASGGVYNKGEEGQVLPVDNINGKTYYWRIRATDDSSNESDWLTEWQTETTSFKLTVTNKMLISGVLSGETIFGEKINVNSSGNSVNFQEIKKGEIKIGALEINSATNYINGFQVLVSQKGELQTSDLKNKINSFPETNLSPKPWFSPSSSVSSGYFGYSTTCLTLDGDPTRFLNSVLNYAGFTDNPEQISKKDTYGSNTDYLLLKLEVNEKQPNGEYRNTLEISIIPNL